MFRWPPTAFERRLDGAQRQMSRQLGGKGASQYPEGVAVRQIVEGHQRGRVVLPQRRAQGVGVPRAGPNQALVCSGEHLDRLGVGAVAGALST
jgi:hypothetical protein